MTGKAQAKSLGRSCLGRLIALALLLTTLAAGILSGQRLSALAQEKVPAVAEWASGVREVSLPDNVELADIGLGGEDRMTLLVMGLDEREGGTGAASADVIAVANLDLEQGAMSVLFIPSNLWVAIPEFGEETLGSAYGYGEMRGEGGPGLMVRTVEESLGLAIDHYVCFDFVAFRAVMDAIGGVTMEVKEPITDDRYPDGAGGFTTVAFEPGLQHMDGEEALRFVRTRHGGEFARMGRQQEMLWAVKDKAGALELLPSVPDLVEALGGSLRTDLGVRDMAAVVHLGLELDRGAIALRSVEPGMVRAEPTTSGASVLVADQEALRGALERLDGPPPTATARAEPTPAERLTSVEVLNGSSVAGLARRTSELLEERGHRVVLYADADRFDYQRTFLVDLTGRDGSASAVASLLGVAPDMIYERFQEDSPVDVRVVLGEDFTLFELEEAQ